MREVAVFRPNTPLLIWVEEWSARPEFARKTDPDAVAELIVAFLEALRRTEPREGAFRNLAAAATLAASVAMTHSEHGGLCAARCQLLRELGDTQRALDLALSGSESWATTIEAAAAYGELGRREQQVQFLRRAIALAPEEPSAFWQLGKALVETEQLGEAESTFLAAPPTAADAPFPARAAAAYLCFLRTGDREPLGEFELDPRPAVQALLNDARSYDTLLPDPLDRVVDVIRSAMTRGLRGPGAVINVKARIDGCAAPSAQLAFALGLASIGQRGHLTLLGEREPSLLGGLWETRTTGPIALVEQANSDVTDAVRELARRPFHWTVWSRSAAEASDFDLDHLLRVAVHPPEMPLEFDAVQWLSRVHTAIALLMAYNVASWPERRSVIERALAATDDWICRVGIVAWFASTQREPRHVDAAFAAFERLLSQCRSGLLPAYARTLAILGSRLSEARAENFCALRARVALLPEGGDLPHAPPDLEQLERRPRSA
jgi:tetratricopeptide (TPR) repeat protein